MNKIQNFKTPEKNSESNKPKLKSTKSFNNPKSSIKTLSELSKILFKYISDILPSDVAQEKKEKISNYFNKIFFAIKKLSSEKKNIISKYDSILRLSEEKIRSLYSTLFNMKIKITFLENNIDILLKKEKEYRLVKEKTGILVENGVIVHNDRKENEIFILRTENSNLKNVIKEKEEKIKELNDINNKHLKENISYEKKIDELKHKLEQIKYKFKIKNNKIIKGHSCSCIDLNNMNITDGNNSTKFNITVNNSLNKGIGNKFFINGIINNNNYGSNSNIYFNRNIKDNINNIKRRYNSNLLNYNYMSLIHCQSMGHLNLNILNNTKSKIKQKNKSKSKNRTNNNDTSKNKSKNENIILNNINVSPIHHKKKLYFTPHNNTNNDIINKINFHPIKKSKSKNNSKSKIKKKNNNSSCNGIKVIYNSKTKINKNTEKEIIHKKLIKELTWSQNASINNSGIPKSTTKLKKRINSKRCNSKKLYNEQDKNKKNSSLLIMNITGKENVPVNSVNKTCLSSIRRKNTINTSNNSFYSKNNFNI